jgi:hypothetical protein
VPGSASNRFWANALRSHGADLTGVPLHVQMNAWMPDWCLM